ITKYNILDKKHNQEVLRMIPYTSVLKKKISVGSNIHERPMPIEKDPEEEIIDMSVSNEEIDYEKPIPFNELDKYL
ncbi:MAG TPA: hypothetical protein PK891_01855, partial [Bacteroidales bacterium]|nr:hypothetical protein [Bacteroidales bacterium]